MPESLGKWLRRWVGAAACAAAASFAFDTSAAFAIDLSEPDEILQTGMFDSWNTDWMSPGAKCETCPTAPEPASSCCESGWCNLGEPFALNDVFKKDDCGCPEDPWFKIGGWTQIGYTNRSDGVFNTVPHRLNLHQQWLYAERIADGKDGLDFGFRADIMYGIDANNTQAFGNPPGSFDFMNGWDHGVYGFAMPQLYGEVAYDKLSVKLGHFYTPLGYEVVTAPGNFFYSHAFTHNFSEPFTHTGVLGTYKATDNTTVYGGWTLGWDTGFDQLNQGNNFIGGFSQAFGERVTFTYLNTVGNLGFIGQGYTHSIVVAVTPAEKWSYVLSSDLVHTNADVYGFGGDSAHTISLANYLFYEVNDCVKIGGRGEWWKVDGVSYQEITGGLNIKPHANLVFRPEIRYQWTENEANPFGLPVDKPIFGIDAILTY